MEAATSASHKRKRDALDQDETSIHNAVSSVYPALDQAFATYLKHNGENDLQLAEVLAQHNAAGRQLSVGPSSQQEIRDPPSNAPYTMTVPPSTASTFAHTHPEALEDQIVHDGPDSHIHKTKADGEDQSVYPIPSTDPFRMEGLPTAEEQPTDGPKSPPDDPTLHLPKMDGEPGEYMRTRKDNHKEVERRRRETINDGISALGQILPREEKNKGKILSCAVQFINQLKENETQNIEKWTLEKMLTEQAIAELSKTCDAYKAEVRDLRTELAAWMRAGQRTGFAPTEVDAQEPVLESEV